MVGVGTVVPRRRPFKPRCAPRRLASRAGPGKSGLGHARLPRGPRAPRALPRRSTSTPTPSCGRAGSATTSTRATSRRCPGPRSAATSTCRGCVEGGIGAQFFGLVSLPIGQRTRPRARSSTSRSTRSTASRRAEPGAAREGPDAPPTSRGRASAGRDRRAPRHRGRARARGRPRQARPLRAARRALPRPLALQRERGGYPGVRPRPPRRRGPHAVRPRARAALRGARRASSTSRTSTRRASSRPARWRRGRRS